MLKNKSLILATLVVIILGCISIFYFKKPVLVEDSYNITMSLKNILEVRLKLITV